MSKRSGAAPDAVSATDSRVIPIVEEQAVILKRKTLTEGVRVRTVVHEDEAVIDESTAIEDIEIERVSRRPAGQGPAHRRASGRFSRPGGTISVFLEESGGTLRLCLSDDGKGLPADPHADPQGSDTGIRLIEGLAGQLGAESTWPASETGTTLCLDLPEGGAR